MEYTYRLMQCNLTQTLCLLQSPDSHELSLAESLPKRCIFLPLLKPELCQGECLFSELSILSDMWTNYQVEHIYGGPPPKTTYIMHPIHKKKYFSKYFKSFIRSINVLRDYLANVTALAIFRKQWKEIKLNLTFQ